MRLGHRRALFLGGYLVVELRGPGVEQVVMAAHREAISLYEARLGTDVVTGTIALADVWRLYRQCRHQQVKIRFLRRGGMPFLIRNALRRKSMLFGMGLFVVIMMVASSFVWSVKVTGVDESTAATVLQTARESGLYVGTLRWTLADVDKIQQRMLAKLPDLVFLGVHVEGTQATVEAVEKIPGLTEASDKPHDVIAAKPAVIRQVFATRGHVLVKAGQVVRPGQVLISGSLGDGSLLVPAAGKVLAEVWYTTKVELPLSVTQAGFTGQSVTRGYLVIGPWSLRLWGLSQPRYADDVDRVQQTEWRFGQRPLPIQWRTVKTYEVSHSAWLESEQVAQQRGLALVRADIERRLGESGSILGQKVLQWEVSRGKLYGTVLTRTEEDIGIAANVGASPSLSG